MLTPSSSVELLLRRDVPGVGQAWTIAVVDDETAERLLVGRAALIATPGVRQRYRELIARAASLPRS